MTRFARAKGSKASNERKEEEPTPWHVMRQQLLDHSVSNPTNRTEDVSYDLKQLLNKQNVNEKEVWSDFGIQKGKIKTNKKEPKVHIKSNKNSSKEDLFKVEERCVEKKRKNKTSENTLQSEYTSVKPYKYMKKGHEINGTNYIESNKTDKTEIKPNTNNCKNSDIKKTLQKTKHMKTSFDPKFKKHTIEHPIPISSQIVNSKQNAINLNVNKNKNVLNDDTKPKKFIQNKLTTNHKAQHNSYTISANGRNIEVVQFEGFLIKKEDAMLLKKIRKQLRTQNVSKEKIKAIMKLERRKAEKALSREKTKVCFYCREFGHNFADCPDIKDLESAKSGICFKCGSTEHSHTQCKVLQNQNFRYAVCFVCKEQGHIARQCSLNPQGQFPKGGSCHLCGEVSHLRKDCPKSAEEKPNNSVTVGLLKNDILEDINEMEKFNKNEPDTRKNKLVKF